MQKLAAISIKDFFSFLTARERDRQRGLASAKCMLLLALYILRLFFFENSCLRKSARKSI